MRLATGTIIKVRSSAHFTTFPSGSPSATLRTCLSLQDRTSIAADTHAQPSPLQRSCSRVDDHGPESSASHAGLVGAVFV